MRAHGEKFKIPPIQRKKIRLKSGKAIIMKKQKTNKYKKIGLIFIFYIVFTSFCYAQEYKIGSQDILKITFFERPELDKTTKVGLDGTITLPVIGSVKAAGLTITELTQKIISQFSIYAVQITQAFVEVVSYESNKIFITGSVTNPGKYVFEKIPNLWRVISEAGGPTESANLSNVLIIRGEEEGGTTIIVNLVDVLQQGDLSHLPKLQPGDNIHISGVLGQGGSLSLESLQQQRHIIYIYGEVASPGIHSFDQSINLLEALIIAGGPTRDAKLKDVRVVRRASGSFSRVIKLNIESYVKEDAKHDFFRLLPEDIVYIPRVKSWDEGFLGKIIFNMIIPITVSTLIVNLMR